MHEVTGLCVRRLKILRHDDDCGWCQGVQLITLVYLYASRRHRRQVQHVGTRRRLIHQLLPLFAVTHVVLVIGAMSFAPLSLCLCFFVAAFADSARSHSSWSPVSRSMCYFELRLKRKHCSPITGQKY